MTPSELLSAAADRVRDLAAAAKWRQVWCIVRGGHFYLPQFMRCCRCDYLPKGRAQAP